MSSFLFTKLNKELFKDRILEIDDDSITYVGFYGEDLRFDYRIELNDWVFNSLVLNTFDLRISEEGMYTILFIFCFSDIKFFENTSSIRDIYSYKLADKFYNEYVKTNNLKYLNLLKREIEHINNYIPNKRKFVDLVIAGYDKSLDEVSKRKIDLFLNIRKRSIKKEKEEKRKEKLKWKRRMKRSKKNEE